MFAELENIKFMSPDLVYIDEYGLLGSNFYWYRFADYGISKDEIIAVGLTSDRVQVSRDIILALQEINQEFQETLNCRLYVKEGYRSPELYRLVYDKRVEKFGQEMADKLLNIKDMPHASGKALDVALWDEKEDKEIMMRSRENGAESLLIDFYKDRTDEEGKKYQDLQVKVRSIMEKHGFKIGPRNEFFHFNHKTLEL
ncbi:MAG: hypothetical protein QG665_48 [Patescibacteria group bacterium]|nr:hypothetical protein [Patescibacteria group bacterium]